MTRPGILLLAACGVTAPAQGPAGIGCPPEGCALPAQLRNSLAVEVAPPAGSADLAENDVLPEMLHASDGHVRFMLAPVVRTRFTAVSLADPARVVPSIVYAWRESRIPGRPPLFASVEVTGDGPAELVLAAGFDYTFVAVPHAPASCDAAGAPCERPPLRQIVHLDPDQPEVRFQFPERSDLEVMTGVLHGADQLAGAVMAIHGERIDTHDPTTMWRLDCRGPVGCLRDEPFTLLRARGGGSYRLLVEPADDSPPGAAAPTVEYRIETGAGSSQANAARPVDLDLPALEAPRTVCQNLLVQAPTGDAQPVGSATVIAETDFPPGSANFVSAHVRAEAVSDEGGNHPGRYALRLYPGHPGAPQRYRLTVAPPSGSFAARWSGAAEIDVANLASADPDCDGFWGAVPELGQRPTVTGVVVPTGGGGASGIVIEADRLSDGPGDRPSGANPTTATDATGSGRFSLRVDPGVYDFEVRPPDGSGLPRWSRDGILVSGDVPDLQIALPAPSVTMAEVVDARGVAVAGASIRAYVLASDGARAHLWAEATTGADGSTVLLLPNP